MSFIDRDFASQLTRCGKKSFLAFSINSILSGENNNSGNNHTGSNDRDDDDATTKREQDQSDDEVSFMTPRILLQMWPSNAHYTKSINSTTGAAKALKQVKFVNVDPDIFWLKVAITDVNTEVAMIGF